MRKVKVILASHSSGKAGAEKSMLFIAESLDPAIFSVSAIVPSDGWLRGALMARGIPCETVPSPWLIAGKAGPVRWSLRFLNTLVCAFRHCLAIRRLGADLVISNSSVIFAPAIAAKLAGVRHAFWVREYLSRNQQLTFPFGPQTAYSLMSSLSKRMFCVSTAVFNDLPEGVRRSGKALVLTNAVPTANLAEPPEGTISAFRAELGFLPEDVVFGVFSTVYPQKRQEDAVLATALARKSDPRVKLLVAGRGDKEYLARLRELADREAPGGVTFVGFRDDIAPVIHASDAVLSCSVIESFGLTMIEAFACGKPVIAAAAGGALDIVTDGEDGFLVQPMSPKAISEKMLALSGDPEEMARMSANARKASRERFSPDEYAKKINRLILDAAAEGEN